MYKILDVLFVKFVKIKHMTDSRLMDASEDKVIIQKE